MAKYYLYLDWLDDETKLTADGYSCGGNSGEFRTKKSLNDAIHMALFCARADRSEAANYQIAEHLVTGLKHSSHTRWVSTCGRFQVNAFTEEGYRDFLRH